MPSLYDTVGHDINPQVHFRFTCMLGNQHAHHPKNQSYLCLADKEVRGQEST